MSKISDRFIMREKKGVSKVLKLEGYNGGSRDSNPIINPVELDDSLFFSHSNAKLFTKIF